MTEKPKVSQPPLSFSADRVKGLPPAKLAVVKNGVDLDLFRPAPRENDVRRELHLNPTDFMCLYVGTHGMAHGLNTLLEAAEKVRSAAAYTAHRHLLFQQL